MRRIVRVQPLRQRIVIRQQILSVAHGGESVPTQADKCS